MNYSELEFMTFCCIAMLVAFCMLATIHTQLRRKYEALKNWTELIERERDQSVASGQIWKMECEDREELIEELRRDCEINE